MKKKTIIIESVILIISITLLVFFLGLPQMLDLNKRANKQKNISQLTELSISTNKFLDKYLYSMTADLSSIKEKMEYTQRLNVPGDSKYQYLIYGGIKDADLRYVVSYDLFDLMNQSKKNDRTFINSVNAYVISAKERMLNSPDSEKYKNYIGYLDILTSKLNDESYFRRAQYTKDIVNPKFNTNNVSNFGSFAQGLVGSSLFKDNKLPVAIIIYLSYINQVDSANATEETFDTFYNTFTKLTSFSGYYLSVADNTIADGMKPNDVKEMFNDEFRKFYFDSIQYPDKLNKGIVAIGTNAVVDPTNRLTNNFLNDLVASSYQKEVNQVIDDLLSQYPGDHEGFARALRIKINEYKDNDINRQIIDIYESVFNYMQYQEYLHKSINSLKEVTVNSAVESKFKEFFHSYILKYDKAYILNDLANRVNSIVVDPNSKQSSLMRNVSNKFERDLLNGFKKEIKSQPTFLSNYYASKDYSDLIKTSKLQFIEEKTSLFVAEVKSERLTIDYLKNNIAKNKIIEDSEFQQELQIKKTQWENDYSYIQYLASLDNPSANKGSISQALLADSINFKKVNKNQIDRLTSAVNDTKEKYFTGSYDRNRKFDTYAEFCATTIASTVSEDRMAEFMQYQEAILRIVSDFIANNDYPEFAEELGQNVRNELNDLYKEQTLAYASLSPEYLEKINTLNSNLTNYDNYTKFATTNRIARNKLLSKDIVDVLKDVSINPEGLIHHYNYYLFYAKDIVNKDKYYASFGNTQLEIAKKRYIDDKISGEATDWTQLEKEIAAIVKNDNQETRAQFTNTMKLAVKNYKAFRNDNYKYENAFNFNGLISDLARVENNIKLYRGPIDYPFYDKDEYYLIYGRFIEDGNKKLGISLVTYTDIHNFPQANAVVVRNLASSNEDTKAITVNLQGKLDNLISQYQQEIEKLKVDREEFSNIKVIHNNDPNFKITTQSAQAKKIIRDRFAIALEKMLEEFVREIY